MYGFFLFNCRVEQCKESLKQLGEIASEADDLREQALYDCCRFDALLEFGKYSLICLRTISTPTSTLNVCDTCMDCAVCRAWIRRRTVTC